MMITSADPTPRLQVQLATARSGTGALGSRRIEPDAAPIVVAVDDTRTALAAAGAAVRLARDLAAPLVFVYVRRGPSSALGKPYYQRRLDREMRAGRRALDDAMAIAERAGVPSTGEEIAGTRRGASSSSPACAAPAWSCSAHGAAGCAGASPATSSAAPIARWSSPAGQRRRLPERAGCAPQQRARSAATATRTCGKRSEPRWLPSARRAGLPTTYPGPPNGALRQTDETRRRIMHADSPNGSWRVEGFRGYAGRLTYPPAQALPTTSSRNKDASAVATPRR